MSRNFSDQEFAWAVDSEGGVFDALFGYGLTAADLADKEGKLYRAVAALDAMRPEINALLDEIDLALEEALEE